MHFKLCSNIKQFMHTKRQDSTHRKVGQLSRITTSESRRSTYRFANLTMLIGCTFGVVVSTYYLFVWQTYFIHVIIWSGISKHPTAVYQKCSADKLFWSSLTILKQFENNFEYGQKNDQVKNSLKIVLNMVRKMIKII